MANTPVLNPVLTLRKEPKRTGISGGGKGTNDIRRERLDIQRSKLTKELQHLYDNQEDLILYGDTVKLVAVMFEDSLATSYTPYDLLDPRLGCELITPIENGYIFEINLQKIVYLIQHIQTSDKTPVLVDISHVQKIDIFDEKYVLKNRSLEKLWLASAPNLEDKAKLFTIWFSPFRTVGARDALMLKIIELQQSQTLLPTYPTVRLIGADQNNLQVSTVKDENQQSIANALRRYRNTGHASGVFKISSKENLKQVIGSGVVHRIDPIRQISVTSAGEGREPNLDIPNLQGQPIVGVIDGGLTANSYKVAEAWRAPAFVNNQIADHVHGNQITSLIVQGHAWNKNLSIPELYCRIGVVQAIPKEKAGYSINIETFISYLRNVIISQPKTKVWNLSFNEVTNTDPSGVSYLGHNLAGLSRELGVLFVISGGNVSTSVSKIAPPADCEAAIVVGGREYDGKGLPSNACPACATGPGPDGMLKPDVSWFSNLRVIGGHEATGSSYATTLISSLAAHTFENLKNPTPDLVRALIINSTELEAHNHRLGWGTPYQGYEPWICQPGSVTLMWKARLRTKLAYYWEGIPIPPELIQDGKLKGTATLTAILKPITKDEGDANYFVTRLQTSLQYQNKGKWQPLLGSMKEDVEAESKARNELAKWYPVRHHRADFSKGRSFDEGSSMRLYARGFSRDLYQLNLRQTSDLDEDLEASFVLTFNDGSTDSKLYDAVKSQLGNFVESAVLETNVEIEANN